MGQGQRDRDRVARTERQGQSSKDRETGKERQGQRDRDRIAEIRVTATVTGTE